MVTGSSFVDLEEGDVLTPLTFRLSPFLVRAYCHGIEESDDRFHGTTAGAPQLAPPTIVHTLQMSIIEASCTMRVHDGVSEVPGLGKRARLHVEYDATQHDVIRAGQDVAATGIVKRRYSKRGRDYIQFRYKLAQASDGKLLVEYHHTNVLSFEPSNPAAASGRGAATEGPRPVGEPAEDGEVLVEAWRTMTRERMRWYSDALHTVGHLEETLAPAPANTHTDEQLARDQGLPGIIADGMVSGNWISSALIDAFGEDYLRAGTLKVKFIRPIVEDERIRTSVVAQPSQTGEDVREVAVSCATENGVLCTVGRATVPTTAGSRRAPS